MNTSPRKVCVVVTARPSYSRIKTVLQAIAQHADLELQLVVAASALLDRYGYTVKIIEQDGFAIASRVYMVLEGENLVTSAKSTGLGLSELSTVFENLQPDLVITVADRFETMATAVAASFMNIPLVHVQGGEVTGSVDEKVRHAVTKLANCHFASTRLAAERIIRMGEDPANVFVTGCPSIDLARLVLETPALDFDPFRRYGGVGADLDISDGYLVAMQHSVTTEYEEARHQIGETLRAVCDLGMPTLWFWPNVDAGSDGISKGIRAFRENEVIPNIRFFKNMEPQDFLRLVYNSRCLVGNSSVGVRECSFLGVPVVNIGTRQRGRERGMNVRDVGYHSAEITAAIQHQLHHGHYASDTLYGDGYAGEQIARLLTDVPLQVDKMLTY